MAFISLNVAETDAKSPLDDDLFEKIKDNFDDLDARIGASGANAFILAIDGKLQYLNTYKRSVAHGMVNSAFTPTASKFLLKKSGTGGTLAFDIRRHTSPKTPILSINHQYTAATSSIARRGTAMNTSSIARATPQISTQSITHAKASKAVQSIVLLGYVDNLGSNMVQYNLDTTVDSDTVVGDSIVFASCTAGGNNGTFVIVEKNRGGGNNVVVSNASGVTQTGVAGNGQLKIMSYNFTNPVSSFFQAGYTGVFASHTAPANDGTLTIYAVNNGGNSLWVKNNSGVAQAGVAGTADTNLWVFTFPSAVSTTNYVVGETAHTATHTSALNDGDFTIVAINSGGNNLVLHNSVGVSQGGSAGTTNTNRWAYTMPTDPSADVIVAETIYMSGHTTPANNGSFVAKEVTSTLIVVYNLTGAAQGGAAGNVYHTKKIVTFSSDQSAVYTTDSYVEFQGCVDSLYNYYYTKAPFDVTEVNRGGGANYNIVIEMSANPTAAAQVSPAGYVQLEMKSIFTVAPSLATDLTSLEPDQNLVGTSTDLVASIIPANTPLMLYITSYMTGDPRDLTVTII